MAKVFASQGDLTAKKVAFTRLTKNAYAYSAEGDPTSGIIIGDDCCMVVDTRATPVEAADLIKRVRKVTNKPIKYVLLTHYHAVRVMGAAAYKDAAHIICSEATRDLIVERGAQDFKSEVGRFPRLFQSVESVPGLTWPTMTFKKRMTIWLGKLEVQIAHLGRGHTKGDTIAWLPKERVLFSGDLVENGATCYAGDAYITEWPITLEKLRGLKPKYLIPGRGAPLKGEANCNKAISGTQAFLRTLRTSVAKGVAAGGTLKEVYQETYPVMKKRFGTWAIFDHCMPFDVSRSYDEAKGVVHPRIWTAKRDIDMWRQLEG